MKKILFALTLLVTTISYAEDFAGKHVELYRGKTIEVIEPSSQIGYQNFYSKFDKKNLRLDKLNPKIKLNPTKGSQWVVNEIYKDKLYNDYILEIVSGKTTAYYLYNKVVKRELEFKVVGGLDIPEEFYCNDLYHWRINFLT